MLLVVFEEFEVAIFFSSFILFIIIVNLHKVNFSNNLGGAAAPQPHPPPSPVSTGLNKIKENLL